MAMNAPVYQRILLKLSGESLKGKLSAGIEPEAVLEISGRVKAIADLGVQVALVIGGGNIFRGLGASRRGMDRVTGDHMGMLATVINALALQDALQSLGARCRVFSAIEMTQVADVFTARDSRAALERGEIVIFAGGTGCPWFTTDTTASLRANEIKADAILKATKVDGIYSADPKKYPDAVRYPTLSYRRALAENLEVMDATAFAMCMDSNLPIVVFDFSRPDALLRVVCGDNSAGSVVSKEG